MNLGYIVNLEEHKNNIHPELYKLLKVVDDGEAEGVDYDLVEKLGNIRIVDSRRSVEKQLEYMKESVSWVDNPLASYHIWGLAVDLVYRKLGYESQEVDGYFYDMKTREGWDKTRLFSYLTGDPDCRWGADFGDYAHVEYQLKVPPVPALSRINWWENTDYVKNFLGFMERREVPFMYPQSFNSQEFDYDEYKEQLKKVDEYFGSGSILNNIWRSVKAFFDFTPSWFRYVILSIVILFILVLRR